MNNTSKDVAEFMEGRVSTKGNSQQCARIQTQCWDYTTSRLLAVREAAQKDKEQQFTNLYHHINETLLKQSFMQLKRQSAAGLDGVTWSQYSENISDNINKLYLRLQNGRYKPKPARRVYIPKEDGTQRSLSIICLEDKIVQQATVTVLNQVYETDFLGFSYGFRPHRGQHDALDSLHIALMKRKVNWVLDLDISKFFDTVEHSWLIKFIQHRVVDKRILRLIMQWIKVGIVDESGHRVQSTKGTPQGAVISPLLANIYLHYSFDLWMNEARKKVQGDVIVVRYADDSVLGFQKHADAISCLKALTLRLDKFGLKVHPDKTRLIRFGRYVLQQYAEKPSIGKPNTFDFLGFTHYIGRKRSGEVVVKRKTKRKKSLEQLKYIRQELRRRLHDKPCKTGRWLKMVVQGHINYYGVPFNSKALCQYVYEVRRIWLKALRRRSQRKRMNWSRFELLVDRWIPEPKIVHPYPEQRFYVKHPR
ncbi:MAG: group II intron reverse transcriptase/maturase [Legionellaceae bacterium]|nr:group II intron reverse transcriptase/maturase [Legionellaceae bacterium]